MRETTRLLCAHVIEPLAELIESFIMRQSNAEDGHQCYQIVVAGHWELSMRFMNNLDSDVGLYAACIEGSLPLVHAFIDAGADDYDMALRGALAVNNVDYNLVDLMIARGGNPRAYECMRISAKFGNIEACRYLISQGSDKYDAMLEGGCLRGRMDIIQLAISNGADNWDIGLRSASKIGNLGLCVLMLHLGAAPGHGLYGACLGGHLSIARRMVTRGAINFNNGLRHACVAREPHLIKYMIQCGATNCSCGRSIAEH